MSIYIPVTEELCLARICYALSDPVRIEIIKKLIRVEKATCKELIGKRPKSSMSHHFRVLREVGLLNTVISGATHINYLRREDLEIRFPGLLSLLKQYL